MPWVKRRELMLPHERAMRWVRVFFSSLLGRKKPRGRVNVILSPDIMDALRLQAERQGRPKSN